MSSGQRSDCVAIADRRADAADRPRSLAVELRALQFGEVKRRCAPSVRAFAALICAQMAQAFSTRLCLRGPARWQKLAIDSGDFFAGSPDRLTGLYLAFHSLRFEWGGTRRR